jgi:hypothetical protein
VCSSDLSGLIAGGSLAGVCAAFLELAEPVKKAVHLEKALEGTFIQGDALAIAVFMGLVAILALTGMGKLFAPGPPMTGELSSNGPNGEPHPPP